MIKIYSKDNCSFCEKAKFLLKSKNIEFQELKIGVDITVEEIVKKFPGVRTVTIVVDGDGNYIGGFNELYERVKNYE